MKYSEENCTFDYDNLQEQNQLFQKAIDQWSNRYEELKLKYEQMTMYSLFYLYLFYFFSFLFYLEL